MLFFFIRLKAILFIKVDKYLHKYSPWKQWLTYKILEKDKEEKSKKVVEEFSSDSDEQLEKKRKQQDRNKKYKEKRQRIDE